MSQCADSVTVRPGTPVCFIRLAYIGGILTANAVCVLKYLIKQKIV